MKYKSYSDCNYIKIYERADGRKAIGLRAFDRGYFIEVIFYDDNGIGIKDETIKEFKAVRGWQRQDAKKEGLKELSKIKKELEAEEVTA
jgi:hypothetical protein